MAFVAPDDQAEEVDDTPGFTASDDQVSDPASMQQAMAVDPTYQPLAVAHGLQPGDPDFETAYAVQQARDALPRDQQVQLGFTPSRLGQAAAVPGQIAQFATGLVASPALNTASIVANTVAPNSPVSKKLQTDSMRAEQGALQPLASMGQKLIHWLRSEPDDDEEGKQEDAQQFGPQAAADDQARTDAQNQEYQKQLFAQKAQDYAIQQANAQGKVSDEGVYAGAADTLGFQPSEVALSPDEQKAQGVQDLPGENFVVNAATTAQDPTNIPFALAPEVPGVGAALKGAGKVLDTVSSPLESVASHIPTTVSSLLHHPTIFKAGLGAAKLGLNAAPALADFVTSAGELASGAAPAEGASAFGLRAKRALAGTIGGAAIGGGAAAIQDQDPIAGAMSGAGFGLAGGALAGIRPLQEAGAANAMEQHGADLTTGNPTVDAKHDNIMQTFSPEVQSKINQMRSALSGDGTNLVLTDQQGFNDALASNGTPPAEGARGVYQPDDQHLIQSNPDGTNTVYLNTNAIGGYSGVGPLDAAGHEIGHSVLDYLQKNATDGAAQALRNAVESNLTPAEKQQISDAYSKDISGNTEGQVTSGNPIDENIAEITRKVLGNEDISNFALPKPLTEKIKDTVSNFFGAQRGDSAGMLWGTKEINAAKSKIRDALYDQGQRAADVRQRARDVASGAVDPNVQERLNQIQTRMAEIGAMKGKDVTPQTLKERDSLTDEAKTLVSQENARRGILPPAPPPSRKPQSRKVGAANPTAPQAPTTPSAPVDPQASIRSDVEKALISLGKNPKVAKETAAAAQGADVESMTKDALARLAKPNAGDIGKPTNLENFTAAEPAKPETPLASIEPESGELKSFNKGDLSTFGGKTEGLSSDMGDMASGATGSLYGKLFEKLQKGDTSELGRPSKTLQDAKPAFDAGVIKTAEDLRKWVNGDPDLKKQFTETQKLPDEPVSGKPTDEEAPTGGTAVASPPMDAESPAPGAQEVRPPNQEDIQAKLNEAQQNADKRVNSLRAAGKSATKEQRQKDLRMGIEQEERLKSLSSLLSPDSEGLKPVTDPDTGMVTIHGEVDPENPVHAAILKESGLRPADVSKLLDLQNNKGKGVVLRDYNSAAQKGFEEGGADFSAEQRNKEYQASQTSEEKGRRKGAVSKQDKSFTPFDTVLTKNGVNIRGFDHDKFLNNLRSVMDAAKEHGAKTGLEGMDNPARDAAIKDAFPKISENHANGYKGDGSAALKSFGDNKVSVNPDYTPHQVDPDIANTINAALNISPKEPSPPRGKEPTELALKRFAKASQASKEAQGSARLNEGFYNPATGETNPLRDALEAKGFDTAKELKPTISNIRPDLIEGGIHDTPTHGKSVHAHGFDISPQDLTVSGTPKSSITRAGFLPGKSEELKSELEDKGYTLHRESSGNGVTYRVTDKNGDDAGKMELNKAGTGDFKYGDIASVHVAESARRQGIAELMYREAAKELQNEGYQYLRGDAMGVAPMDLRKKIFGEHNYIASDGQRISEDEAKAKLPLVADNLNSGPRVVVRSKIDPNASFLPSDLSGFDPKEDDIKSFNIPKKGDLSSFLPGHEQDDLGFYSHLADVVADKIPNKAKPDQIMATLKGAGVKQEEIDNMGLKEFLDTHDGPVSKQDLQDFVKAGGVQMQEVTKGSTEGNGEPETVPYWNVWHNQGYSEGEIHKEFPSEEEFDNWEENQLSKMKDSWLNDMRVNENDDGQFVVSDRGGWESEPFDTEEEANEHMDEVAGENADQSFEEKFRTDTSDEPNPNYKEGKDDTKFSQYTFPGGPLSRDTEILTDNGWKRIDCVKVGEKVLTRKDEDSQLEWQPVLATPSVFAEKLYHFKSRSVDMRVTNLHQMVVWNDQSGKMERLTAERLWANPHNRRIPLTGTGSAGGSSEEFLGYNARDVGELIGWFLAEGSHGKSAKTGIKTTIKISQSPNANRIKRERIISLLSRLGISWSKSGISLQLGITSIREPLLKLLRDQGGSLSRYIPASILRAPLPVIQGVIDGMILGDGTKSTYNRKNPQTTFYTGSKVLADGFQALLVLAGKTGTIGICPRKGNTLYRINVRIEGWAAPSKAKFGIVDYGDIAFCVTVKNHAILVRSNGIPAFTGNSNYREILLTLPEHATDARFKLLDSKYKAGTITPEESAEMTRLERAPSTQFQSSHWDEPNVLAHIRQADHTDSDGNKVRLIEEIQSDWHQKGRKEGYKTENWGHSTRAEYEKLSNTDHRTPEQDNRFDTLERLRFDDSSMVPDAPFKKTWQELAFKRALRTAVEDGQDKIAWPNGDTQATRYALSEQVDGIRVHKLSDKSYSIEAKPKGGGDYKAVADSIPPEKLEDHIGKELAEKAYNDLSSKEATEDDVPSAQYEGEDLKIGGKGMRGFYDKILPDFARKYVKKWGASVGQTKIGDTTVHSIPITDAMREAVMGGQSMFLPGSKTGDIKSFNSPEPKRTWFVRDGKRVYHQRHPLNGQFVSPNQTLANFNSSDTKDEDSNLQLANF